MKLGTVALLALAPFAAAKRSKHHGSGSQSTTNGACPSPALVYSTYCCHGSLLGPSVSAASASASGSAAASSTGSAAALSHTLSDMPSSLTAHVPIPIHTNSDTPPHRRDHQAASSLSSATNDHTLASGVVCRGSVATITATGSSSSAAPTTTLGVGLGPTAPAATSSSAATSPSGTASSRGAAASAFGEMRWAAMVGAGVGVGIGMGML